MDCLTFEPYLRPMVWGGRRLADFGKTLPTDRSYGESWEISVHPHHVSRVAEGPLRGAQLTEICAQQPREIFGEQVPPGGEFPWLIKLLDCQERLSIQVHPSDADARRLSKEHYGKTEAWVVLEVQDNGWVYAGLLPGVDRAVLERHLEAGTVDQCLHRFQPRPGDCIFLPAGTVHGITGGIQLAEVQQSSDVTFRLFDWNRPGTDGQPRPLHIRESLESIDWRAGPVHPSGGEVITNLPAGIMGELLVRCPYFSLTRYRLTSIMAAQPGTMRAWLVQDGLVQMQVPGHGNGPRVFRQGETVLQPASGPAMTWQPVGDRATLVAVELPA